MQNVFRLLTNMQKIMEPTDVGRKAKEESEVPSAVAVASFADLIERAAFSAQRFVVTAYGKPRAAIVGIDDLERLRALDAA